MNLLENCLPILLFGAFCLSVLFICKSAVAEETSVLWTEEEIPLQSGELYLLKFEVKADNDTLESVGVRFSCSGEEGCD